MSPIPQAASAGWDARRAVQTVAADAACEDGFRYGSGYLVAADLVLSAAHALHGAGSAKVWFTKGPGRACPVEADTVFADASADVAVLRLRVAQPAVAPVVFGYPQAPVACDAVGFPRFNLNDDHRAAGPDGVGRYRDSHHAEGRCRPASLQYAGTLALQVPAPGRDPEPGHSPWEGMSGAAVFAGGALIAVVGEHHAPQGLGALTATRVDSWYRLDAPRLTELRQLLGLPETAGHLTAVGTAPAAAAAAMSLPRDLGVYTGRARDLEQLVAALDGAGPEGAVLGIHAVDGMGGVGKTTFAVHAAHTLAGRFPDGQWFVRLHGHTPGTAPAEPGQVLADLLAADGAAPDQIPPGEQARADAWRVRTAGRRMLLVLDDAANSAQVRPLLPSAPGALVLVTSRRRLTALADAVPISLDVLDPGEACELFARIAARPGLDPGDAQVAELAGLCGHLPLAVGIVAARLRHRRAWTPQDLIEELTAVTGRLPALTAEDLSVAAAFALSYRDLNADQQHLFRALGASPAIDTDPAAAAAMLRTDPATARRLLGDLEEHRLIDEPTRGRFRMHDLLREHARTQATTDPGEHAATADRVMTHYRNAASQHKAQDPDFGLTWLRLERANLLTCLGHARDTADHPHLIALTAALAPLLEFDGPWPLAATLHTDAADAADHTGDRLGQANALNNLGRVRYMTNDYPGAREDHQRALDLFEELGNRLGQANALNNLGRVRRLTSDYPRAREDHQRALDLFEELGNRLGQANTLNDLGRVRQMTGDYPGAREDHQRALDLYRELGDRLGQANTLNDLGRVRQMTGDYPGAREDHQRALDLYRELGDRLGQANALNDLGRVRQMTGDYPGARKDHQQALDLYRELGDRHGQARALNDLGSVRQMTNDYPGAREDHQRALKLYEELDNRHGQANALNDLGRVRQMTGDYPGAKEDHQQALKLYEELGDRLGQADALNDLGECCCHEGDCVQAAVLFQQALKIYRELGVPEAENVAARLAELGLENTDSPN